MASARSASTLAVWARSDQRHGLVARARASGRRARADRRVSSSPSARRAAGAIVSSWRGRRRRRASSSATTIRVDARPTARCTRIAARSAAGASSSCRMARRARIELGGRVERAGGARARATRRAAIRSPLVLRRGVDAHARAWASDTIGGPSRAGDEAGMPAGDDHAATPIGDALRLDDRRSAERSDVRRARRGQSLRQRARRTSTETAFSCYLRTPAGLERLDAGSRARIGRRACARHRRTGRAPRRRARWRRDRDSAIEMDVDLDADAATRSMSSSTRCRADASGGADSSC